MALVDLQHEGLIDLQLVGADLLQIGQGRQARAVVVDGDADPGGLEALDGPKRHLGIVDHCGLGDLEAQGPGRAAHHLEHPRGEAGVAQQTAGEVHRGDQRVALVSDQRQLLQRAAQDPFGQGADMAGLFGHGDETIGSDQAPGRVAPADQHLRAGHLALAQVELWLVVQQHLALAKPSHHLAH